RRRTSPVVCETAKAVAGSTGTTTSALTVGIWEVWHETGRGSLHPRCVVILKEFVVSKCGGCMLSRAMGLVAAGVLMLGSLAACGSDDGDDDAAEPSTPETTTSPSPTVPPQPDGPHGVTLKIDNWDEYYDDPAVLTVKDFLEGFGGAYTAKKITPELKSSTSKKVLRELTGPLKSIWRDERLPADTLALRILSVKSDDGKATVQACAHEI